MTEEQAKKTAELEYAYKDLKRFSNNKGGKAVDIVFENNKMLVINGQAGVKCEIKNIPDFWIKTEESAIAFPEKGAYTFCANTVLKIYTECPVFKNFEAEGRLDKVRNIDFTVYLDKEETAFRKIKDTDHYVKENEYMVSAFDWGKFFKNEKEKIGFSDDLFCDKTELLKKFDKRKWFDAILGNRRIISVEELYCVYGNKGKIENAEEIRSGLRKVVCTQPIEWDASLYKDLPNVYNRKKELGMAKMSEEQASRLKKIAQKTDIWSSIKHLLGGKNNLHFVHPLYFLNHLNKAAVFEFNPYEGKKYSEIFANCCNDDDIYDKDKKHIDKKYEEFYVKTNPGFAPVYDLKFPSKNTPNVNGYACVTGFFNSDYMAPHKNDKIAKSEYYHEGVDFRGGQGTDVVSLVYGEIICFGSSASMGGIVLMRARFDTNLYYLAVHLDETSFSNLKENKKISPGDRIAKIGSYDSRGTHLHVSAIKLPEGVPPIGEGANKYKSATYKENGIWKFPTWGQESIYRSKMKNPFDYNSSDYWAGFTLKK